MLLPDLLHELVTKFVTMDDMTKLNLKTDGGNEYVKYKVERLKIIEENKAAQELNESSKHEPNFVPIPLKKLSWYHKMIGLCETVWARYLFAALFIALVPVIRNWINGEPKDDGEDEAPQSDLEMFMEFQRMRKSQK